MRRKCAPCTGLACRSSWGRTSRFFKKWPELPSLCCEEPQLGVYNLSRGKPQQGSQCRGLDSYRCWYCLWGAAKAGFCIIRSRGSWGLNNEWAFRGDFSYSLPRRQGLLCLCSSNLLVFDKGSTDRTFPLSNLWNLGFLLLWIWRHRW